MDVSTINHNECLEELGNLLCTKTQNIDSSFFYTEVVYFLCKLASCMRAHIITKDRGNVPINAYCINFANSGAGKGYSISIMENEILGEFKKLFIQNTLPTIAKNNIEQLAENNALLSGSDKNVILDALTASYNRAGAYPFTFDSGTAPAVKQLRTKLLLAGVGSINYQVDEISSNLLSSIEILNIFLELFDKGQIKQKLIKNTQDSVRDDDIDGSTPANMLLFGTPVKLFDGGQLENQFYSLLEIGYARRSFFGISNVAKSKAYWTMTPEEIYKKLISKEYSDIIDKYKAKFTDLANPDLYNFEITLSDDVAIELMKYKVDCEKKADAMSDFDEIRKAEMSHRYFKTLKLAGAFAFINLDKELKLDYLNQAIKFTEESGKAFDKILTRDKPYMRLAKYIAGIETELTHADLTEKLPFYKTSATARNEMMSLAIAWGYKNSILIKKNVIDGIEMFSADSLEETDLDKLIVSSSTDDAYNYEPQIITWNEVDNFGSVKGWKWCNHHFIDNHRLEKNAIKGFNLIVLDIDNTATIEFVKTLFENYTYFLYTTKSHTQNENRFRLILPTNYILKLDEEDFKEFMNTIYDWLPFKVDTVTGQRSRMWYTNTSTFVYKNEGKLIDVLPFIPKTRKNEQYIKDKSKGINSESALERWFLESITTGNRNNSLFKYAMALKDGGKTLEEIQDKVISLNNKLADKLTESELRSTIFTSLAKEF